MDTTYQKIFLYDHVHQLLFTDGYLCLCNGDNGPMNKNPLKAHRGISNKIIFRALNPDRSPVDLNGYGYQVYGRIVDPENQTIVIEKLCVLGPAKGLITLYLDSGDLAEIHSGRYHMALISTQPFVVGQNDATIEKPLFSDLYDNISFELEVTDQAFYAPAPSIIITPSDWTGSINIPTHSAPVASFYSQRIPGARTKNHISSVHSFSTYTNNFTGTLEIWGTLDETPSPYLESTHWFQIFPSSMSSDIQFTNYTGTTAFTFQSNVMYLKFRYTPSVDVLNPGTLDKLIVRI